MQKNEKNKLMDRVNEILKHPLFAEYLERNRLAENERIFCRHELGHFLDVCRIAWILVLEEGLSLDKELVYAAGLLHDTGRWLEVATGEDHALSSARLAMGILEDCGFEERESREIVTAIKNHRRKDHPTDLARIIYKADKLSRSCFACKAIGQCKKFQNGEIPRLSY